MTATTSTAADKERGWRLWYPAIAGIWWWMVHLVGVAAFADTACMHPWVKWVLHASTVVLALLCLQAAWWAYGLVRAGSGADDASPHPPGRIVFMGWFGVIVELTSVILIVWEGLYLPFVDACT